ncbi:MAG: BfmA/BtgA family mobilization protein [Candidatus Caldarchaeales archaeon]
MSTIKISEETKRRLEALKIHFRETYEDVIKRLIEYYEKMQKKA